MTVRLTWGIGDDLASGMRTEFVCNDELIVGFRREAVDLAPPIPEP